MFKTLGTADINKN